VCAILADTVLLVHFTFVLFAVFGGFVLFFDYRLVILHVITVIWSALVNLAHWTCPLTPLEQYLRTASGQVTFQGGWIQHYFDPIVRPLGMPHRMELIAGVSILVWNFMLYCLFFVFKS
jgi:hypothetical protein